MLAAFLFEDDDFGARPWSTTVAVTFAPSTKVEPTFVASPSVVARIQGPVMRQRRDQRWNPHLGAFFDAELFAAVLIIANDISFVSSVSLTHH